jgi:hypothetical protein
MIKRLILTSISVVALLAAAAGTASAKNFTGTVVHRSVKAQSFVVADKRGRLTTIHSRKAIKVGRVVKLEARRLHNGTYGLRKAKVVGRARHARLRGTVSFVNRRIGAYVVSVRGASILVHKRKARGARAADATTPAVGDVVTVDATLDDQGEVEADNVTKEGVDTNGVDLHGVVLSVDKTAGAQKLTLSADDDDDVAGATITVNVPDTFDITKFTVGQEVELIATLNADSTYTLVGTTGDDSSEDAADDPSGDQGDTSTPGDTKSGDKKPSGDKKSGDKKTSDD